MMYSQIRFSAFDLGVIIQNGQFYEATVPVNHCPSESGCRSLITQAGRNNQFSLTENFMITFKVTNSTNFYVISVLYQVFFFFIIRLINSFKIATHALATRQKERVFRLHHGRTSRSLQ